MIPTGVSDSTGFRAKDGSTAVWSASFGVDRLSVRVHKDDPEK